MCIHKKQKKKKRMQNWDVEAALRKVRRPVIDPENVWTYLPMILVYMVLLVALVVYRIGMSLHPWIAPSVVLLLIFVLVILAGAKVDDWWISNGGSIPTNILAEEKLKSDEKAKRTVELYTPTAIVTFWLAYSLFFMHGGLEMLVPELISNAASLLVFLLVMVTNAPPLRKRMIVAVATAILIVGISLFVPGPSSLASIANIVISLHKITAFSLLYLLTEISSKLRQSPLRNGYSSSHVRKWIQTAWILFAGRFVSLLGWVQVGWVIWILQKQLQRSAFINNRSQKRKVEDLETSYTTTPNHHQQQPQQPQPPPPVTNSVPRIETNTNTIASPRHQQQQHQQQQPSYSNGIITNSSPPSVGRIIQPNSNNNNSNQSYSSSQTSSSSSSSSSTQKSWPPPNVIHSNPPNRGLSGRTRYVPRSTNQVSTTSLSSSNQSSRKKNTTNHRRTIAKHGGSPLDQYSGAGGF